MSHSGPETLRNRSMSNRSSDRKHAIFKQKATQTETYDDLFMSDDSITSTEDNLNSHNSTNTLYSSNTLVENNISNIIGTENNNSDYNSSHLLPSEITSSSSFKTPAITNKLNSDVSGESQTASITQPQSSQRSTNRHRRRYKKSPKRRKSLPSQCSNSEEPHPVSVGIQLIPRGPLICSNNENLDGWLPVPERLIFSNANNSSSQNETNNNSKAKINPQSQNSNANITNSISDSSMTNDTNLSDSSLKNTINNANMTTNTSSTSNKTSLITATTATSTSTPLTSVLISENSLISMDADNNSNSRTQTNDNILNKAIVIPSAFITKNIKSNSSKDSLINLNAKNISNTSTESSNNSNSNSNLNETNNQKSNTNMPINIYKATPNINYLTKMHEANASNNLTGFSLKDSYQTKLNLPENETIKPTQSRSTRFIENNSSLNSNKNISPSLTLMSTRLTKLDSLAKSFSPPSSSSKSPSASTSPSNQLDLINNKSSLASTLISINKLRNDSYELDEIGFAYSNQNEGFSSSNDEDNDVFIKLKEAEKVLLN
jgi:hypothetical protein